MLQTKKPPNLTWGDLYVHNTNNTFKSKFKRAFERFFELSLVILQTGKNGQPVYWYKPCLRFCQNS